MNNLAETSPFNSIRRFDEQGNEFWLGRELMPLLQYLKWQRFEDAIDRAKVSCKAAGNNPGEHFIHLPGSVSAKGRFGDDCKLTRYACHLVAMNGDVRKEAIAQAQAYFSAKAHEAETVIPAQNDELEILRIQLGIAQANAEAIKNERLLFDRRANLYEFNGETALLVLDNRQPIVVEKQTIETIDEQHKVHFKGQTLKQVAEYVKKRYGIRLKDGGVVKRLLKAAEKDSLIAHVPRSVTQEYIPQEHLDEVYRVLTEGSRQMLLGE